MKVKCILNLGNSTEKKDISQRQIKKKSDFRNVKRSITPVKNHFILLCIGGRSHHDQNIPYIALTI